MRLFEIHLKRIVTLLFLGASLTTYAREKHLDSAKDDLRIFLSPPGEEEEFFVQQEFEKGRPWAVTEQTSGFRLFNLRDGTEFGRFVPALWVQRQNAKYSLAIIDEGLLFAAKFENARIEENDVLVFNVGDGKSSRAVRMKLVWLPDRQTFFVERQGVEFFRNEDRQRADPNERARP